MRTHTVLLCVAVLAATIALAPLAGAADRATFASPLLVLGPQASPAGIADPGYGIFNCQLGLSTGACYDPYQIRHSYNIDSVIKAGFDGKGKTIVIIDAFQSPNIVEQLNVYISFYGLPSLNGLGNPPDSSLGTFYTSRSRWANFI